MKQIRSITMLALMLLIASVYSDQASAATLSASQQITVTGRVPPMINIIVDQSGQIIEITSNTTDDVTPNVYLLSLTAGNQRALTTPLYKEYRAHVPAGTRQYGILYKRSPPVATRNLALAFMPMQFNEFSKSTLQ